MSCLGRRRQQNGQRRMSLWGHSVRPRLTTRRRGSTLNTLAASLPIATAVPCSSVELLHILSHATLCANGPRKPVLTFNSSNAHASAFVLSTVGFDSRTGRPQAFIASLFADACSPRDCRCPRFSRLSIRDVQSLSAPVFFNTTTERPGHVSKLPIFLSLGRSSGARDLTDVAGVGHRGSRTDVRIRISMSMRVGVPVLRSVDSTIALLETQSYRTMKMRVRTVSRYDTSCRP